MAIAWPLPAMERDYPELGYKVERIGPIELKDRFEDGGIVGREKVSAELRRFTEKWNLTQTDMGAVMDYFETQGTLTAFQRREIDANSGTWATDEVSVTFAKRPTYTKFGPNRWKVTLIFEEVAT